jgi:hypothetical protein
MKTIVTIGRLCWVLLLMALLPRPTSAESKNEDLLGAPVTVELVSRRTFTAGVDARTDASRLWLRWSKGSARVLRPIQWDHVRRVSVAGEEVTGQELQRRVEALRPQVPSAPKTDGPRRIVLKGADAASDQGRPETAPGQLADASGRPAASFPTEPARVHSLAIDVGLGKWQAGALADGLVIDVYPMDAQENVIPARGSLEVDLVVPRNDAVKTWRSFEERGRWTQQVRLSDFGPNGARYRLPFAVAAFRPELDLDAASSGLVQVRLSVPGQGVFAATQSDVRVRPHSPMRAALQQATGSRLLPDERTGDGRH